MAEPIKVIECPRDAWQGLQEFIPTDYKAEYLRELVLAGFQHIDAVSFVSPKHVKQMADSEEVMAKLGASWSSLASEQQNRRQDAGATKEPQEIIGIVVNEKGLARALATPGVTTIGYPYSISAYFRRANANMSREESRSLVEKLKKHTLAANRGLVIYISMAFGIPTRSLGGRKSSRIHWSGSRTFMCAPFLWPTRWARPRRNLSASSTGRSKLTLQESSSACTCTAGRKMRRRKSWQRMKRDAGALTARSPDLAAARLPEIIWSAISPPRMCLRRSAKLAPIPESKRHGSKRPSK